MKGSLIGLIALSTVACCAFVPCDPKRATPQTRPLIKQTVLVTATCPDLPAEDRLTEDTVAYLSVVAKRIDEHLTLYRSIPKPGVVLQFSVSTDGSVQGVSVIRPSGHPDIDLALQRAVFHASPFDEPPGGRIRLAIEVTFETDDAPDRVTRGPAPAKRASNKGLKRTRPGFARSLAA